MLDLQIYGASCADATLTALGVIADHSLQVQNRPNPRIVSFYVAGGANRDYATITSPGLPNLGIRIPATELGEIDIPDLDVQPLDVLTPSGYQSSGGAAEMFFLGVLMGYHEKIGKMPGRPCSVVVGTTDGSSTMSAAVVQATGLDTRKKYQILGAYVLGATNMGAQFISPSFRGLRPGLMGVKTDYRANGFQYFPEDDLPTFDGADGLWVRTLGNAAANTATTIILLNEIA